jgi:hypothetical protein
VQESTKFELVINLKTAKALASGGGRTVSVAALVPYLNEVAGLAVGGVASAFSAAAIPIALDRSRTVNVLCCA